MPHRIENRLRKLSHYPRTIALAIGITILAGVFYDATDRARKNKVAIEKGCILLNNAIIRSVSSQTDPHSPSVPLIKGILAVIPQKYVSQYETNVARDGTPIPLVNCRKVADNPDDIKAEQLPSTPAPPPHVSVPPNKR